jgi:hypothetical protein
VGTRGIFESKKTDSHARSSGGTSSSGGWWRSRRWRRRRELLHLLRQSGARDVGLQHISQLLPSAAQRACQRVALGSQRVDLTLKTFELGVVLSSLSIQERPEWNS